MSIPGNGTANAQAVSGVECGYRHRGGVCHGERAPRRGVTGQLTSAARLK
ncbi:MAG UNVERIFIED_CONTAM: hypothetical protein LVR18_32195 [Planctomycetaceae bacterium]